MDVNLLRHVEEGRGGGGGGGGGGGFKLILEEALKVLAKVWFLNLFC